MRHPVFDSAGPILDVFSGTPEPCLYYILCRYYDGYFKDKPYEERNALARRVSKAYVSHWRPEGTKLALAFSELLAQAERARQRTPKV